MALDRPASGKHRRKPANRRHAIIVRFVVGNVLKKAAMLMPPPLSGIQNITCQTQSSTERHMSFFV
jgi:hypothetical protein